MNELQIRQMQISRAKDEIRCCNELNQIYGLSIMGNTFSNIHIRKKKGLTQEAIITALHATLAQKGYIPVEGGAEAKETVAIFTAADSGWFTLCGRSLSHGNADSCAAVHTYVPGTGDGCAGHCLL